MKLKVYNEVRFTAIAIYEDLKKPFKEKEKSEEDAPKIDFDNYKVRDTLEQDEEEIISQLSAKDRMTFIVKMTTIQDEWKKMKKKAVKNTSEEEEQEKDPAAADE